MQCKLIVDSSFLTENDILLLNKEEKEIQFSQTKTHNFLPPEVILVLIELSRNITYSAAYDAVKYALNKLISILSEKKSNETPKIEAPKTKIEIVCGDQKYSASFSFELTENQKNQLVDVATKKLLEKN